MWTVARVSCHSERMSSGQFGFFIDGTIPKSRPQINTDYRRYEFLSVKTCVYLWLRLSCFYNARFFSCQHHNLHKLRRAVINFLLMDNSWTLSPARPLLRLI